MSIATLLVVLVFHVPGTPEGSFVTHSLGNITMNVLLIQNLPAQNNFSDNSILGPMWSLPYEVQMYLVLPGIFVLLGQGKKAYLARTVALAVAAVSLARLNYQFPLHPLFQFFPCFFGGVVAWQVSKVVKPALATWLWPLALVLVNGAFMSVHDGKYVWFICLALGGILPFFRRIKTPWVTVPSGSVAKYSYGIYLVHYPILWAVLQLNVFVRWPAFVVLIALISVGVFHLIEKPMIDFGSSLFPITFRTGVAVSSSRGSLPQSSLLSDALPSYSGEGLAAPKA